MSDPVSSQLISVIVPVYKVEKYLARCVDSIRAQTYRNLEIILVDDGSPDSCPAMCDAFAGQDWRIRVIHKENGGLSSARNAGIEAQAAGLPCVFSDRVTDEVLIMPHACRVSLEEGTGTWAEAILSMSENTDRAEGVTLVREAGYDIRTESARLEKRYLELGS